jgi:hypothetical protein
MSFLLPAGGSTVTAATYRYFLMDITLINGSNECVCRKWDILVGSTSNPTANMTGPSAPSPLVASSSNEQSGREAWNAFDEILTDNNHWQTDGQDTGWLKIDLGSGNEIAPTSFTWQNAHGPTLGPKNFTFEGSNTGSFSGEETILYTGSGETSWATEETRTFTL